MTKASATGRSDPNSWLATPGYNVTAAGNNQATAFQIPNGQDLTLVTTCAAGAGVNLPLGNISPTEEYVVANHGANACLVYAGASTGTMGTASAGTGYSLAAGKTGYFVCVGGNGKWTTNP